ncbi:MAG: type II toxin-antitoxin system RelB/DinJ family antitoxin [Eggerthellaceae bacterium]|nr:type II toxin-antitoxin system RelB/DinJ family antitoxin [Eggerthellaceae bacterium]
MPMTISLEDPVKTEFAEVCAEIGMSASTAFNIFAKAVIRERRIPFELSADSSYEQQRHAYERRVNEGLWRGYQQVLEGKTHSLDEVIAERERREKAGSNA